MELRHLRYFVAVAEDLNFSHAAQRLHVSQPPLSRQIRDLEEYLGVQLFERAKNKIRLTEAGQFLFGEAKRLLQRSEDLIAQVRRYAQTSRAGLNVGYIANVHGRLVIEAATRFRQTNPEVTVKVFDCTTTEQVAAIASGRLDLGFVGLGIAPAEKGLHIEPIGTTSAVMAIPLAHPLAKAKIHPLSAFKNESFITINENAFPGTRQFLLEFCADAGFRPHVVHEALQPIDVLNLVAIGEGVALVPEQMRRWPTPGVVFGKLRHPVPTVRSYVAWKEGSVSSNLAHFVRTTKEAYTRVMRGTALKLPKSEHGRLEQKPLAQTLAQTTLQ